VAGRGKQFVVFVRGRPRMLIRGENCEVEPGKRPPVALVERTVRLPIRTVMAGIVMRLSTSRSAAFRVANDWTSSLKRAAR
jgi:hypothetical protein